MRNQSLLLTVLLTSLAVAGCLGDSGDTHVGFSKDPSYDNPVTGPVTGFEHVARLRFDNGDPYPTGGGNFVVGDYVFGSALNNVFFIADISDPSNPQVVYTGDPDGPTPYGRKAEVVAHPDGRYTLALATQSRGVHFWDVTDPYNPVHASLVNVDINHYVAVLPGTEVVVSNPSRGEGSTNTFIDVSNPYNPQIIGEYGDYGCHGTVFFGELGSDKFRGYCAGVGRTEIWDLDGFDPSAPDLGIQLRGIVDADDNPLLGVGGLHHLATVNHDATVLIIGDEFSGGGQPGACFFYDDTTGKSTPFGAIWFYDIADEDNPVLRSWLSPYTTAPYTVGTPSELPPLPRLPSNPFIGTAGAGCTAHFGQTLPDENKLVIAWYAQGVLLVDFTDLDEPRIIDQYKPAGTNVWSARVQDGYVFTGDINRGMDVLRLVSG